MERVCFLHKVKISRIVFDSVRAELNLDEVPIKDNPYNSYKSKCITLTEKKNTEVLLVLYIWAGTMQFTIDIYRNGQRIKRIEMFGPHGNVGYEFTRLDKEEFYKVSAEEFWKAYSHIPHNLKIK